MDFQLNEFQAMLSRNAREILTQEYPRSLVRRLDTLQEDYDRGFYQRMAELGWLGLLLPEHFDGCGGEWLDCALIYEQFGRALVRSPHFSTVVLGGQLLLAFGTEEQKSLLLPRITAGRLTIADAVTASDGSGHVRPGLRATARQDGSYEINGARLFVANAHHTDFILAATRSGDDFLVFLVPGDAGGLTCTPMGALGGEKLCEVVCQGVRLGREDLLGGQLLAPNAVRGLCNATKLMVCAEMLGASQAVLDMTVEYCGQRLVYGRPVGSFQSPQHLLVDMAVAISGLRWLLYSALFTRNGGTPDEKASIEVQFKAGNTYPWVTRNAIHLHGAIGLTAVHDLNLYYVKSRAAQLNLGLQYLQ